MTPNQIAIVADDDPSRCQATTSRGQCQFRAVEGTTYCKMHGGSSVRAYQVKQDQRKYKLAKWQERVNAFADDEQLKSLNDEIGILRMTLENVLVACKDENDMLLYAPKIADLVAKIEKVVVTCHKLEASTGVLLTKSAAFTLAAQIVDIVTKHVTDPDAVSQIADEIGSAIANVKNEDVEL